jgi:hypothetical protein
MRFTTASGSVYEVDTEAKKIRRLNGKKDPTPRQGKDGEWREYINDLSVEMGKNVWIQWADAHPPTEETQALLGLAADQVRPYKGSLTTTNLVVEIDSNTYN